jgi:RNA-binding protein NOB1
VPALFARVTARVAVLPAVVAFAKKTGDFRELSRTDLLVLALVYMLEKETCGTAHLRTEPRVVPAEPEAPALTRTQKRRLQRARRSAAGATGDAADAVEGGGDADSAAGGDDDASAGGGAGAGAAAGAGVTAGGSAGEGAAAVVVASETAGSAAAAPSVPAGDAAVKGDDGGGSDGSCSDDDAAGDDDDDDDGGEWIGPESTTRRSTWTDSGAAADGDAAPQRPVRVGCVTTDYAMQVLWRQRVTVRVAWHVCVAVRVAWRGAITVYPCCRMQNVLLQIGLNLVSLNGRAVRTVKQWVLKCDACFE